MSNKWKELVCIMFADIIIWPYSKYFNSLVQGEAFSLSLEIFEVILIEFGWNKTFYDSLSEGKPQTRRYNKVAGSE